MVAFSSLYLQNQNESVGSAEVLKELIEMI